MLLLIPAAANTLRHTSDITASSARILFGPTSCLPIRDYIQSTQTIGEVFETKCRSQNEDLIVPLLIAGRPQKRSFVFFLTLIPKLTVALITLSNIETHVVRLLSTKAVPPAICTAHLSCPQRTASCRRKFS